MGQFVSLVNPADCDCANANQKAKILSLRGKLINYCLLIHIKPEIRIQFKIH